MPGPLDYKNGISAIFGVSKFNKLMGLDIRNGLHTFLGLPDNISINFINDAFAFGIGEAWMGKGIGKERIVAITLGTGFGSAFLHNGVPIVKGKTVPQYGYIYHVPFKGEIAEEFISARWFIARYYAITGRKTSGVMQIAAEALENNDIKQLFYDFGENMAIILAPWLRKFDAEMLIIGGNISGASNLFLPSFNETIRKKKLVLKVSVSELKENAAFIGCGRLADPQFYHKVEESLY